MSDQYKILNSFYHESKNDTTGEVITEAHVWPTQKGNTNVYIWAEDKENGLRYRECTKCGFREIDYIDSKKSDGDLELKSVNSFYHAYFDKDGKRVSDLQKHDFQIAFEDGVCSFCLNDFAKFWPELIKKDVVENELYSYTSYKNIYINFKSSDDNVDNINFVKECACGYKCFDPKRAIGINEILGDANGDGLVDGKDLLIFNKYTNEFDYSKNESSVEIQQAADINADLEINLLDKVILRSYFNKPLEQIVQESEKIKVYVSSDKNNSELSERFNESSETDPIVLNNYVLSKNNYLGELITVNSNEFMQMDKKTLLKDIFEDVNKNSHYDLVVNNKTLYKILDNNEKFSSGSNSFYTDNILLEDSYDLNFLVKIYDIDSEELIESFNCSNYTFTLPEVLGSQETLITLYQDSSTPKAYLKAELIERNGRQWFKSGYWFTANSNDQKDPVLIGFSSDTMNKLGDEQVRFFDFILDDELETLEETKEELYRLDSTLNLDTNDTIKCAISMNSNDVRYKIQDSVENLIKNIL